MRIERRVDGFVAERGGLRLDGTTATAMALGGMLVALAMPACFGSMGIPVGMIVLSTSCVPGMTLLGGTRVQALRVEVSVGPETIDVDAIDGEALQAARGQADG